MFNPIKLITSVVPAIGKAASGDLMGGVTEALKLFGIDNGGPKELANAIQNATPEQLAELKRIDNEFDLKMKEMEVDLETLAVKDRDSARDMQVQLKSMLPGIIGCGVLSGFFLVLILMFFMPDFENRAMDIMLGTLGTMSGAVVNFYFGSSKSSSDKNLLFGAKDKGK